MKIIIIVAIIALLAYVIKTRNKFNTMRHAVQQQGSSIGIQVEHRSQCLHDALNIAKISYSQEVAGIEQLTAKDQLDQLAFLGQKYPALSAMNDYSLAVQKAYDLNNRITAARELLDGNIRVYNDEITTFPGLLVAKLFGYKPEKYIDEDNYEENKKLKKTTVDFAQFM